MCKKIFQFIVFTNIYFSSFAQVLPLTTTTWNQGCFYNDSVPTIAGGQCGKAYTGCYATALAQICKFYNYPTTTWGGTFTNAGTPIQTVNYNLNAFNYAAMPNTIATANVQIATLMRSAGVANDMAYSATVSNSFFSTYPFLKFFKYSISIKAIAKFVYPVDADWINVIKNELNNNKVVFAKGGNHFYIIDGYNNANQFHINFGFGGLHNGYYDILNVVAGGVTYTPTNLIINIKPLNNIELLSNEDATVINKSAAAGTVNYKLTSQNSWVVTSNASWCTPSTLLGSAGYYATLNANVTANTGVARTAIISASDGTNNVSLTINQAGLITSIQNQNELTNSFLIFPIPTNGKIFLKAKLANNPYKIGKIYNAFGQMVKQVEISNTITSIDITNQNAGVYTLAILSKNKIIYSKILKTN